MLIKYTTLILVFLLFNITSEAQLFQEDFGTSFASISTTNWPTACRGGTASSFNTSSAPCGSSTERAYSLYGSSSYITSLSLTIPASGYELAFEYSYNSSSGFPTIEIRTGGSCGTSVANTTTLSNTGGSCDAQTIDLSAFAGQTIFIRFRSNSSATFYFDEITVDVGSGGGGGSSCLLDDNFGTSFQNIDATNWPAACRVSASSFNTSSAPCGSTGEYGYSMSGFGKYITTMALTIPGTGFDLDFEYSFNYSFSFPSVEIRTGSSCGTSLSSTTTLTNTGGVCTPQTINLDLFAGQTIYIRFRSNTSSATFYLDEVKVCGASGTSGDYKWADNFNDNDLTADYAGNDGDEACTGCGDWTLNAGASLELVPSGGWGGNTVKTEAFPQVHPNIYYVKLDIDEYIESPTMDLSGQTGLKISFYAKSSSSGTGGGDSWSSFSDHLRLEIWDGSAWITVKDITEGTSVAENKILPALPFNYFCFTAYNDATAPGNYYYTNTPNVNAAYFHSDFKFRVIFEGGFSGTQFAWVDDFTFRADADGYSTMIPCGISFWNQTAATSYGQDPEATSTVHAERGVELELDNSINSPPDWLTEANDGDQVDQVFATNESERVVFCVLSEQEIDFSYPRVHFSSPSIGNQSSTLSIDNSYSGPGWKYYAVEYISCDLAGGSISEPTDQFVYYYSFEYGNEFIPAFYHLNSSGIETGGGATSSFEQFDAPDLTSSDDCGCALVITLDSLTNETCELADGAINITVTGAPTPTFMWSNGATTESLTDLSAGVYIITATDPSSGCTAIDSFTIVNNETIRYITSISDGNWLNQSTWDCNCIPAPCDSVVIDHKVTIISSSGIVINCTYVEVSSGSELTSQTGAGLQIKDGYLTNAGNIYGDLECTGTADFTIKLGDVEKLKVSMGANNLSGIDPCTISGELDLTNGNFLPGTSGTGAALCTLKTDCQVVLNGGNSSDEFVFERQWPGYGTHFISLPCNNGTAADFKDDIVSWYPMYHYTEATNTWSVIASASSLQSGFGYVVHNSSSANILDIQSTLKTAVTNLNLTHTGSHQYSGWNLVGNPFMATLDWDVIAADLSFPLGNVSKSPQFWDPNIPGYATYINGVGSPSYITGKIPSFQGFMVYTNTNNTSLQFSPDHATSASPQIFIKNNPQINPLFRLELKGQDNTKELVVLFSAGATDTFDINYDALFLSSMNLQEFATLIPGQKKLTINNMHSLNNNPVNIQLHSKVLSSGNYIIRMNEFSNFGPNVEIILEDILLEQSHLLNNGDYSFTGSPNDLENRFNITVKPLTTGIENIQEDNMKVHKCEDALCISLPSVSQTALVLNIINTLGQKIYSTTLREGQKDFSIENINIPASSYYFVEINSKAVKIFW